MAFWLVFASLKVSLSQSQTFKAFQFETFSQMLIIPDQTECQRLIQTDHVAQFAYTFKGQMYEQSS